MRITKATNITASTTDVLEPTVDNVLNLIENKKIIFKNDVAYWSKGKSVLPKEYRDCIEQTQYAHWINEWSCEQAEKLGDRAYYDYDGDTEVKATNMRISKSTKTDVKASIDTEFSSRLGDALRNALIDAGFSKRKAENMGITELLNACHEVGINCDPYIIKAREASSLSSKTDVKASSDIRFNDYCDFVYQNSKLSREDAKDICVDCWNQGKSKEEALEMAKTSSTKTDVKASNYPKYVCRDGYIGTFQRVDPGVDGEEIPIYRFPGGDSMVDDGEIAKGSNNREDLICGSTSTDKALQHIKAAIDILGTSGDKSDLTRDSIANLSVVMFDLKSKQ